MQDTILQCMLDLRPLNQKYEGITLANRNVYSKYRISSIIPQHAQFVVGSRKDEKAVAAVVHQIHLPVASGGVAR